eukprot:6532741-Ditylum_brightwellii.AAC.1
MSNGCSYIHEHSDPGNGFLIMVGGEVCTRMFFPDSESEATLTAKGTKLCLSIFSYSKEDIKKINKTSRN